MNSRRSWIIFLAGVAAYVVAITQRSSLGVAAVDASERFHSTAVALSTLGALQLLMYAALQVPVGVLIDRLGPRALILTGTAVMATGQLVVALAPVLGVAIAGRMLVGAGDAAIFISVLRLISTWFTGSRVPQLGQWLGALGAMGQVISAVPFAGLLGAAGWTPAFLSAASLSVLALVIAAAAISSGRGILPEAEGAPTLRHALQMLRASLLRPGTQLGFWAHYITQSSGVVFSLFWGYPFLVYGIGTSAAFASGMLTLMVVVGVVAGPVLGLLTVRHPLRRSNLVISIVVAMGVAWALVLAWPGVPPIWLVVLLVIAIAVGGPASQIGFDFARTFNPPKRLGGANGVVNVGGFLASLVMMLLIGLVLDILSGGEGGARLYSLDSFRIALLVQFPVVGFGVLMLVHARRRTRRVMEIEEGIRVAPLWVELARVWGRRRRGGSAGRSNGGA